MANPEVIPAYQAFLSFYPEDVCAWGHLMS